MTTARGRFEANHAKHRLALIGRYFQVLKEHIRYLPGRSTLARLYLAYSGRRATCKVG
jgi:hypothetical protein